MSDEVQAPKPKKKRNVKKIVAWGCRGAERGAGRCGFYTGYWQLMFKPSELTSIINATRANSTH
ncbi:MAG: hypothetical protein Q4C85_07605 [Actinomyces sp.]|uniref:hypothetical protein n=1 Tax=Actinomyces sp. TaxID=29317 RepID=UPI0026DB9767|nr:hypothetical protein [Actinomyces sp.]MDO4243608.1 hypothetical protein [Actinomyces sp.]